MCRGILSALMPKAPPPVIAPQAAAQATQPVQAPSTASPQVSQSGDAARDRAVRQTSFARTILTDPRETQGPKVARKELTGA